MQVTNALHRNSVVLFIGFVGLVLSGFWSSYYSNPLAMVSQGPDLTIVHLHGLVMTLWCAMLVSQAYLIRTNRRSWHRAIGKTSYVLAPLVVILQVVAMRNFMLSRQDMISQGSVTDGAAVFAALLFGMSALFAGLYGLAIYFRRSAPMHARFMIATVFVILAPATDRIVNGYFASIKNYLPQVHKNEALVAFALADIALLALTLWDWRSRPRRYVFPAILVALLAHQTFTLNAHRFALWREFCAWFLHL
jgi:hypothetical protein